MIDVALLSYDNKSRGEDNLCISKTYAGQCENDNDPACSQSCKNESRSGGKCRPLMKSKACYCDGCSNATGSSQKPNVVGAITTSAASTASNTSINGNGQVDKQTGTSPKPTAVSAITTSTASTASNTSINGSGQVYKQRESSQKPNVIGAITTSAASTASNTSINGSGQVDKKTECIKDNIPCGKNGSCYNPTYHACSNEEVIVCKIGQLPCGIVCYNVTDQTCVDGGIRSCPVDNILCGGDGGCYNPTYHACSNGEIIVCEIGQLPCGIVCYNVADQTCVDGGIEKLLTHSSLQTSTTYPAIYARASSATFQNLAIRNEIILTAETYDREGKLHHRQVDLNQWIANKNGILRWEEGAVGGHFGHSCQWVSVTQSGVLSALCSPLNGALNPTSINLNEAIANVDGVLDVNLKSAMSTVSGWKVRGIFIFGLNALQSSQICLERCRATPGCVLISWQDHFGCFGYSNTTEIGLVADPAWTSMTLSSRGPPKVLPDTEYLGDDLRYSDEGPAGILDFAVKPETASNGELCWKLCVIHPHCNVAVPERGLMLVGWVVT
ncbi:hypothetical protein BV898_19196 [Hypsibius exemplaris]|uniref:Cyanovirin-N domain-containing protein n=1 Tax=Hypsibius exemplaris TaxID=2072580 RepID=A0A9X6RP88_HYPEX|nr:hypothetical protein BV898_19196 [Hypsibius exemplaris]